MEFRIFLILVMRLYWTHLEFTAKEFSSALTNAYLVSGLHIKHPLIRAQIRTKLVSNNLRRLHLMGFLKRRRIKRTINKAGKSRTIGFEYRYQVSLRGRQYFEYLVDPAKATKKHNEKLVEKGKILPPELMDAGSPEEADIFARLLWKRNEGRYKGRFPTRFGGLLAMRYLVARKLLRQHGVPDLSFEKKCLKLRAGFEMVYPHLKQVFKNDTDALPDPDGKQASFLELLWLLPSPQQIYFQCAQSADPEIRERLPILLESYFDIESLFNRLSENYRLSR